jgi:peptidoglycan/xylan/chitin deacetylase (PgdA/CDA1 family)
VLTVLTYHRIGNSCDTPYDAGVFSATAEEFEEQIAYLKRRFHVATLDEALAMLRGDVPLRTSVLITFDDGYLDNYALAFPILRSSGVQGAFFLPTSFVGTNHVPWWDFIAYAVKNSRKNLIRLHYPTPVEFDLKRDGAAWIIMKLQWLYKQPTTTLHDRFLDDLQDACDTPLPPGNPQRAFLNWHEAREMQQGGMAFGSHTHTHEILSTLSVARQETECRRSKQILELELDRPVEAFAYPVGAQNAFSSKTIQALKASGYRAAFCSYRGLNRPGRTELFEIARVPVWPQSQSQFRLNMALRAFTGRHWC